MDPIPGSHAELSKTTHPLGARLTPILPRAPVLLQTISRSASLFGMPCNQAANAVVPGMQSGFPLAKRCVSFNCRKLDGIGPERSLEARRSSSRSGEIAELGRDRTREDVVGEVQLCQSGEAAEFGRDRTRQVVEKEIQIRQAREAAELGSGSDPSQDVVGEVHPFQVGKVAEFGWDRAREAVPVEIQIRQAREAAQLGRDRTRQAVPGEKPSSSRPFREVAEFGRDRTRQAVVGEKQPSRLVRLPSSVGIGPVKVVGAGEIQPLRFVRLPSSVGIGPVRSLSGGSARSGS